MKKNLLINAGKVMAFACVLLSTMRLSAADPTDASPVPQATRIAVTGTVFDQSGAPMIGVQVSFFSTTL